MLPNFIVPVSPKCCSCHLRRRVAPSFYTEIGTVGDKSLSCWHISYPNHFCYPCIDNMDCCIWRRDCIITGTVNIAYKSFIMLSYIIKYNFVVCYFSVLVLISTVKCLLHILSFKSSSTSSSVIILSLCCVTYSFALARVSLLLRRTGHLIVVVFAAAALR